VTNLSHIAEVTSPVFAAVAAYASYLSAMNGRRAKQERHEPVLAGSPLQTTERDPNGCAPTRLEIINVGGPAFESASRSKREPMRVQTHLEAGSFGPIKKPV
jgi:hypothetical protein